MTDFSQRILGGGASGEPVRGPLRARPASSTVPILVSLLDQIGFVTSDGAGSHPCRDALTTGAAEDLAGVLRGLRGSDRSRLEAQIPPAALRELLSISEEGDSELFAQSLYQWAQRQEGEDRLDAAALAYGMFAQRDAAGGFLLAGAPAGLRAQASTRLDAILGRGEVGPRMEFLLRRLAREASNPVMIVGMATGSAVFSTARSAFLSRLLMGSGRSVWGARALASSGAFLLEVPAFWATTKGLNEAINPGSQRWDLATNFREMAGLGLTLGALKLSGVASGALSRRLARSANPLEWSAGERLGHGLLQQGGMLGGILFGHRLESAAGLRPHLDGATTLIDSLGMLLQFHVGGRLSHHAMGPRFQAYTRELDSRGRMLEHLAIQDLGRRLRGVAGGDGGRLGGPVFAMAGHDSRPEVPALSMMVGMGAPEASPPTPRRERGIRTDIPAALPERTGNTPDDRFAAPLSPDEILAAMRTSPIHIEIASRLEHRTGEWSEITENDLGTAVGEALNVRLGEIAGHSRYAELRTLAEGNLLAADYSRVPRYSELPQGLREAIDAAAELMQITQYAIRSNQTELLDCARSQIPAEQQVVYQELLQIIRLLKGPRLVMPSGEVARGEEVIGPESAVLSHGAGAMSSWLRVISRRIVPGGMPWYSRLLATEANYNAVKSLRSTGKNPFMSPAMSHNFEGDTPIEPVYFNAQDLANSETVARVLYRTVRVQMLNVPAFAMPEILNESFIRGLPERAILISAIGGVVEPKDETPQYPSDFVRERLDRFGRGDVEVVSLSGFVPADKLWSGEKVNINLSTRKDEAVPRQPRPEAWTVASLLAGESLDNDFVYATTSHWDRSANVGKVLKNVFTLEAGWRTGRIAREVVEAQAEFRPEHPRYQELLELGRSRYGRAREEIQAMMRSVLVQNEGIKVSRADYTPEVWKDFDDCSTIYFDNLVELFRRARAMLIREASTEDIHNFLRDSVFEAPRSTRVATTRNPRYGIARALHEMLVERGLPFQNYSDVGPKVTVEGLNSLDPIIRLYNSKNDIENRRLPEAVYNLHERVFGRKLQPPPAITGHLRWAIERQADSAEARGMQAVLRELGLSRTTLRKALEDSDERTLGFLSRELRRLSLYHARLRYSRSRNNGEGSGREPLVSRQVEYLRHLKEAATQGQIVSALRIPVPIGPFENAFTITRRDQKSDGLTHQVFVRIDNLQEAVRRLTQLGMLLRSFPTADAVEVDVRIPESTGSKERPLRDEIEDTAREIVRSFQSQRPGRTQVSLDRRSLESETELRREPPSEAFYQSLEPLARWVLGREAEAEVSRDEVRQLFRSLRHESGGALDQLAREGNGWVMLLTPSEGPLQSGIRAMLTRPEKATLIGVYGEEGLVDTFAVYRANGREARVLSHHVLSDFRRSFPTDPRFETMNSVDYFRGLSVEEFIRDYREYAGREGITIRSVRPLQLRSAPLEEALVGRNPAINPAELKIWLTLSGNQSQELLRQIEPLYELPPEEARQALADLVQPVLAEFTVEHRVALEKFPLYVLYRQFGFLPRSPRQEGISENPPD